MTVGEAAKYLTISPITLRRWEKEGILIPERVGKRKDRYYTMEMINKFLFEREYKQAVIKRFEVK